MNKEIEQVTPHLESMPERSYKRSGSKIKCFKVLDEQKLTLSEYPLFEIDLLTENAAITLMEDLYYGEYTGG